MFLQVLQLKVYCGLKSGEIEIVLDNYGNKNSETFTIVQVCPQ